MFQKETGVQVFWPIQSNSVNYVQATKDWLARWCYHYQVILMSSSKTMKDINNYFNTYLLKQELIADKKLLGVVIFTRDENLEGKKKSAAVLSHISKYITFAVNIE